ncbi:MAG TPA: undecaprenyl-diphosphate phosphatase [Desulfuromonadales bacterium]|nr:undecaprenyl-diphosphate phosphatase [Desulfuromonadales bacterium]
MTLLEAILLGILQGATEFLPVSSSGHLALAQNLIDDFHQPGLVFDILLHVGTMVAVIGYFWRDLTGLLTSLWRRDDVSKVQRKILLLIVLGSVPTAIIGLTWKDFFAGLFDQPLIVCLMLLVTGALLVLAERYRNIGRKEDALTWRDALTVGAVQGLAIIPGISRSGSTIAALLLRGVDGETAARFSFLLALPAIFGAALLSARDIRQVSADLLPVYLAGTGAAMLTGLLCIHLLMGVIRKRRLRWFALYCWVIGAAGLAYFSSAAL